MKTEPMIAVRDVEASSNWYQQLLGCRSAHGGPFFDCLADGDDVLLLLHRQEADEHPGFDTRPEKPGGGVMFYDPDGFVLSVCQGPSVLDARPA